MPRPKSSISLSITSARPSIRATPSPISRMTPTLCLRLADLAIAICASISCTRSIMGGRCLSSQARRERVQPGPHTTVVDVATDLDPHAGDEARVALEGGFQPGPVGSLQASLDVLADVWGQWQGALDQRT